MIWVVQVLLWFEAPADIPSLIWWAFGGVLGLLAGAVALLYQLGVKEPQKRLETAIAARAEAAATDARLKALETRLDRLEGWKEDADVFHGEVAEKVQSLRDQQRGNR